MTLARTWKHLSCKTHLKVDQAALQAFTMFIGLVEARAQVASLHQVCVPCDHNALCCSLLHSTPPEKKFFFPSCILEREGAIQF